jgi:hypothetical protein
MPGIYKSLYYPSKDIQTRLKKAEQSYPVFLVDPSDPKQCRAWCPFCVRFHYHGPLEGDRVAHCYRNDSPFRETGYILKLPKTKNSKNGPV